MLPKIDKKQATSIYQKLKSRLIQSEDGRQIITIFEKDPQKGEPALLDFLDKRLSLNSNFTNQLIEDLETEDSEKIVTLITGGHVEQLVNIAKLGALNLTIKRHFSPFRDVKQLLVFLMFVILISIGIGYSVWKASKPKAMTGNFNVAVAEFDEIPASPNYQYSSIVSQSIYDFLSYEYDISSFGLDIQVAHEKIGVISDDKTAGELAQEISADLII